MSRIERSQLTCLESRKQTLNWILHNRPQFFFIYLFLFNKFQALGKKSFEIYTFLFILIDYSYP